MTSSRNIFGGGAEVGLTVPQAVVGKGEVGFSGTVGGGGRIWGRGREQRGRGGAGGGVCGGWRCGVGRKDGSEAAETI